VRVDAGAEGAAVGGWDGSDVLGAVELASLGTVASMSAGYLAAPDIEVTEVEDGLVVFEPVNRKVHHLNVMASLVFGMCTGENDVDVIAAVLHESLDLPERPTRAVADVLETLTDEGVVIAPS